NISQGVLVNRVNTGSAAEQSGIITGDVIVAINSHPVSTVSELQEWVARNRPGKEINVTYLRKGNTTNVKAKLKNNEGTETLLKRDVSYDLGGATVEDVRYKELIKIQLEGGVRIKNVRPGKWKEAGIKDGFIIGFIDKIAVDNVEDLNRILEFKRGGILVEGYYPDGKRGLFGVKW
ncbi:MAG TPA: PDZ domain-containing protein, partial [Cyclobacteriaceae bacterium]